MEVNSKFHIPSALLVVPGKAVLVPFG